MDQVSTHSKIGAVMRSASSKLLVVFPPKKNVWSCSIKIRRRRRFKY